LNRSGFGNRSSRQRTRSGRGKEKEEKEGKEGNQCKSLEIK
jgi:hypothetical protein